MSSGTKLRNIGPKSAAWLRQTGIRTQEDLVAVGSLAAYVRVKRAGFKPSLNLLYALEGVTRMKAAHRNRTSVSTTRRRKTAPPTDEPGASAR
jgi:hypothetical protein